MAPDEEKSLDDLTVAELRERASEFEITGRSSMNKADLVQAVEDAEEQIAQIEANNGSSGATSDAGVDSSAETEDDSAEESSDSDDRPWRESSDDSNNDSDNEAEGITAPSIGPHTTIEHVPPEERLDMDEISDVDAMGLDKRRQVQGKRYGASPAKQLAVYGGAIAVIAALVIGGIIATNELDKAPPEGEGPEAPWADLPASEQQQPGEIDFPPSIIK